MDERSLYQKRQTVFIIVLTPHLQEFSGLLAGFQVICVNVISHPPYAIQKGVTYIVRRY